MKSFLRYGAAFGVLGLMVGAAVADPIRHPTAVYAGLDKTTGRIINFDVAITEAPQTTSFVEVDEQIVKTERADRPETKAERAKAEAKAEAKRIFSGWMFAASPGLHGVEHPVYDVWLIDCKGGKEAAPATAAAPAQPTDAAAAAATPDAAAAPETGKKKKSRKVEPKAPAPVENAPIGPADAAPPQPAVEAPPVEPAAPGAEAAPTQQPQAGKKKKRKPGAGAAPAGQQPTAEPQGGGGFFPF